MAGGRMNRMRRENKRLGYGDVAHATTGENERRRGEGELLRW